MNTLQKIFSVTNTPNKKYKVISCCGLTIKINKKKLPRSNKKMRQEIDRLQAQVKELQVFKQEQIIRRNYSKVLRKLRCECNDRKINIVFLSTSNSKFSYSSLYKEFEKNPKFNVKVLVSCIDEFKFREYQQKTHINLMKEDYEFYTSNGYNTEYAFDIENDEFISLKEFNPDIIFYGEPWSIAKSQELNETSKYALACFCCYGTTIHNGSYEYEKPFYRSLFKYFIDNYYAQELLIEHDVDSDSLPVFGSVKLDAYLLPVDESKVKWKSSGKKRVIYAPHHSFYEGSILGYGTFGRNYLFFLEYAKNHPDIEFILKPHPCLKKEIVHNKFMTEEEMDNYFAQWESLDNVQICEQGDYFDMFRTSDLMITDSNSFLSEYLPTEKPLIHLISEDSVGHNEYGQKIIQGYYPARTNEETEQLLDEILYKNNDPLKDKRKEIIENDLVWERDGAAKGIVKYLEEVIFEGRDY